MVFLGTDLSFAIRPGSGLTTAPGFLFFRRWRGEAVQRIRRFLRGLADINAPEGSTAAVNALILLAHPTRFERVTSAFGGRLQSPCAPSVHFMITLSSHGVMRFCLVPVAAMETVQRGAGAVVTRAKLLLAADIRCTGISLMRHKMTIPAPPSTPASPPAQQRSPTAQPRLRRPRRGDGARPERTGAPCSRAREIA